MYAATRWVIGKLRSKRAICHLLRAALTICASIVCKRSGEAKESKGTGSNVCPAPTESKSETEKEPLKPGQSAMFNEKAVKFMQGLPAVKDRGFSVAAVFAHAWHESGAFRKVIGSHNYWGIKVPGSWTGKIVPVKTHEYTNAGRISLIEYFIDFDTLEQALEWYMGLIKRIYPISYAHRGEPDQYFKGLVSGKRKYATDPAYPDKLIAVYKQLEGEFK